MAFWSKLTNNLYIKTADVAWAVGNPRDIKNKIIMASVDPKPPGMRVMTPSKIEISGIANSSYGKFIPTALAENKNIIPSKIQIIKLRGSMKIRILDFLS